MNDWTFEFPREAALRRAVSLGRTPSCLATCWYRNNCSELISMHVGSGLLLTTDFGWSCQSAVRTTFQTLDLDPCLAGSIRGMVALGWLNRYVNMHGDNRLVNIWLFNEKSHGFVNDIMCMLDQDVTSGWFEMVGTQLRRHLWKGHGFGLETLAKLCNHASMVFNFVEYHSVHDLSPVDRWNYVNTAWDVFVARKRVRMSYGTDGWNPEIYPGFSVGYRDYVKQVKNG